MNVHNRTIFGGKSIVTEDAPVLAPSTQEWWQWAQAISMLRDALARARERQARLAHSDQEHAARLDDARHSPPPVRLMTDEEQHAWLEALEPGAFDRTGNEPISVHTAPLATPDGDGIAGWGVCARTWNKAGAPTAAAWAVCRDGDDAWALVRYLNTHNSADDVAQLHALAATTDLDDFLNLPTAERAVQVSPSSLSVAEWEQALRRQLPTRLADQVIITDPHHSHFSAWRQLHKLAAEEHARVGADPDLLARFVREVPSWSRPVRNPPSLAHWAITEARSMPHYHELVTNQPPESTCDSAESEDGSVPQRVDDIQSHAQALRWADHLSPENPMDRLQAKAGYGRWGTDVDSILVRKFPTLTTAALRAGQPHRNATGQAEVATAPVAMPRHDSDELLAYVEGLDTSKPGDRLAARTLLGRSVPEVDHAIAAKFDTDDDIAQRYAQRYPDGPSESTVEVPAAADSRRRATAEDAGAARGLSQADIPQTDATADEIARALAGGRHAAAASHQVAAHREAVPRPRT